MDRVSISVDSIVHRWLTQYHRSQKCSGGTNKAMDRVIIDGVTMLCRLLNLFKPLKRCSRDTTCGQYSSKAFGTVSPPTEMFHYPCGYYSLQVVESL